MIVQNINSNAQIIFTENPHSDYRSIARELKYTKKDGDLYKYVNLEMSSSYYPRGSSTSMPAIKLTAKGMDTYIVKDSYDFVVVDSTCRNIVHAVKHFGEDSIIKLDSNEFNGPLQELGPDKFRDSDGKSIVIGDQAQPQGNEVLHKFIHRMTTDNGRMLQPLMQRFLATIFIIKGNKHMFTGYARLENYLRILKLPTKGLIQDNGEEVDGDYRLSLENTSTQARVKVVGVRDGVPVIELMVQGNLQSVSGTKAKPDPYLLITTKPIVLKNQRMPYTVVSYRGNSLFITPLIFNSLAVLSSMRGGINLLK